MKRQHLLQAPSGTTSAFGSLVEISNGMNGASSLGTHGRPELGSSADMRSSSAWRQLRAPIRHCSAAPGNPRAVIRTANESQSLIACPSPILIVSLPAIKKLQRRRRSDPVQENRSENDSANQGP